MEILSIMGNIGNVLHDITFWTILFCLLNHLKQINAEIRISGRVFTVLLHFYLPSRRLQVLPCLMQPSSSLKCCRCYVTDNCIAVWKLIPWPASFPRRPPTATFSQVELSFFCPKPNINNHDSQWNPLILNGVWDSLHTSAVVIFCL